MANPVSSGELVAMSLRRRTGKLADNVTNHVPVLRYLRKKENVQLVDGGRTLMRELEYAENGNFMWYSGSEALNTSAQDVFTYAEFNWKQAAVVMVLNGLEMRQNSGKAQSINLVGAQITSANVSRMDSKA